VPAQPSSGGHADEATPGDTAAEVPAAPEVSHEGVEDQAIDDGWIFAQDRIHTLQIDLPQSSWDALVAAPRELAPADITYDGVALEDVGMRLRGKIGSFRTIDGKPKIKLDFNRFEPGRRFFGLEAMSLNASVVDCSYVKEPLGYALFEAMGVATSRASYVQVRVNDLDYGLYVLIETQDDRLLERHWGEASGNLYDGKYAWWPDGSYTLLDFGEGHDTLYQLEEGEDVAHADISAISTAYAEGVAAGDFRARTDALLDWDNLHRVWAVAQFMGHNDGYCLNKNNYRVHFRGSDGRAVMVPWDLDHTFYEDHWWSRSWASPSGNLARACFADAVCAEEQRQVVAELLTVLPTVDLPTLNAELQALTAWSAEHDPKRECGYDRVLSERAHVTSWLTIRGDYLRSFWGL
jgi:spore coat protein CotH